MASDSSNCNSSPAAIRQLEETLSSFTLNLAHSIVRSQGDCIPESMVTSDIFSRHAWASGCQSSAMDLYAL
eukprot:CAMPEP_0173204560 /NCGR_PEP_ID=MMETSP1141-20130122/20190_1 /TAXON_ID=483371 /ORGANISM="non described non described, Strain CCMP2298" /LENGTH=70 /DNA_ID=CAMNT_0014130237 /DNA_START=193 /DNA_END=405 /DNA_ORIENTATION=-